MSPLFRATALGPRGPFMGWVSLRVDRQVRIGVEHGDLSRLGNAWSRYGHLDALRRCVVVAAPSADHLTDGEFIMGPPVWSHDRPCATSATLRYRSTVPSRHQGETLAPARLFAASVRPLQ